MPNRSWSIRFPLFPVIIAPLVSLTVATQTGTWYVRPNGAGFGKSWGDALNSVQSVIDSATASDEIWVTSGVYNESITLKAGIVHSQIYPLSHLASINIQESSQH